MADRLRGADRGTTIQALVRADAILSAIAEASGGQARLSEIAKATGLHKTTVFNLVESLVSLRYVAREETTKTYRLGLRNLQLGRAMRRHQDLMEWARPSMMRLCRDTGETVNLAVPDVFEAMIIDSFEGSFTVRVTSYAGTPAAYHSTSCGKAMLAFFEKERRDLIYAARPLQAFTPTTITSVTELERQLAEARRTGFAIDLEENEPSAHCVAVPIFDGRGMAIGSISVAGPASRLKRQDLPATAELIKQETELVAARVRGDEDDKRRRAALARRKRM
jgi:IclR family acetate operon transcriptional repressor